MSREEAWNRIDAIIARHEIDDDYVTITSILDYDALRMARKALEQEPRKITYEDVKGYCKPRCLTIIDNELLYELTHPKIKALEQEPMRDFTEEEAEAYSKVLDKIYKPIGFNVFDETSGDLIERQAVNTLVDELARAISDERCCIPRDNRSTATIMQDIIDLPSVKQEPKTGHWTHDGSHWKNRFICSKCGYKLFDEQTNFCPNCGAKMVEPQESEDKE